MSDSQQQLPLDQCVFVTGSMCYKFRLNTIIGPYQTLVTNM